ncbi:MAG: (2Fe-2S)-binding protein [Deltaproteobacteria bacterium]|nr:(2Fe-2S)-binding protein [Deltaproteobacteria bacterium]
MKGNKKRQSPAITRRGFLTTMGVGAAAMVTTGSFAAITSEKEKSMDPKEMTRIQLHINGRSHRLLVEPRWSLLFVLRERLGLTGTKIGCERGECGACTVLIDNLPRYACMVLAMEAEATEILTVEGLMQGEELGHVQQAFLEHDAFQCGYCTPGQIMAAEGLLRRNPDPSDSDIRQAGSGNLCRCGAYTHIFHAVKKAAELKRGES